MKNMVLSIIVFFVFMVPLHAMARTDAMRKQCSDCHTMHNSQDGATVSLGNGALLNASCYGCHSNAVDGVLNGDNTKPPYVWQTNPRPTVPDGAYADTTLAGGDFYWVSLGGNDGTGHNVEGIVAAQDPRTAPGGTEYFDAARPLTCAGTNGCHGDRLVANEIVSMSRAHHGDDGTTDLSTVAGSYRFLKGVAGLEAANWELTATAGNHNQYKGVIRANDIPSPSTISNLCASCHGDFHNNSSGATAGVSDGPMTNPWIRHPVDFGMALSDEYASYGGLGLDVYQVQTPLASVDVSTLKATVPAANDRIVMCLSCHRAHGSPYDAILRWDYQNWPGGGYNGCGDCHTEKN